MSMTKSIIRQDGDGERRPVRRRRGFTMKASAEETAGAFILFEDLVVRGKTTPMHLHPNEDETIYVLDGELLVDMDGEQQRVGQNGVFVAPRGVPHAFLVTSDTARLPACKHPGQVSPSTATPAIRSPQPPIPTSQPTSRGCASGRALRNNRASRTATVQRRPIRPRPYTRLTQNGRQLRRASTPLEALGFVRFVQHHPKCSAHPSERQIMTTTAVFS